MTFDIAHFVDVSNDGMFAPVEHIDVIQNVARTLRAGAVQIGIVLEQCSGIVIPSDDEFGIITVGIAAFEAQKEFRGGVFKQNGLISGKDKIKILGRGELNKTVNVSAHAFSATAKKAIEDKGGAATVIE